MADGLGLATDGTSRRGGPQRGPAKAGGEQRTPARAGGEQRTPARADDRAEKIDMQARSGGIPRFDENPIGAIGFVLQEAARGFQGQPSRVPELKRQALEEVALELRRQRLAFDAIVTGTELAERLPEDRRGEAIKKLSDVAGFDISPFVRKTTELPDLGEMRPDVAALSPGGKSFLMRQIEARGNTPEAMAEVLAEPDTIEQARAISDEENRGSILAKRNAVGKLLNSRSIDPSRVGALTMTDFEALNRLAPPEIRLDPSELATLRRSEDLQRAFGITPASALERIEEEEIGEHFEGAQTDIGQAREDLKAGRITTEEFEQIVLAETVGAARTPGAAEEISGARVRGKRQERENAPIKSGLAALAGVDPNTTLAEARERGVNVDIRDEDIVKLQEAKAATKTALNEGTRLLAQIAREGPTILSTPGGLAKGLSSLRSQFIGLFRLLGTEVDAPQSLNSYEAVFREAGIENTLLKSRVLDLAFAIATSRETGRLSENDIARAIGTLGATTGDPKAFSRTLGDALTRIEARIRTRIGTVVGVDPGPIVRIFDVPEDLADKPDGTIVRDDEGARFRKVGNKLIEE